MAIAKWFQRTLLVTALLSFTLVNSCRPVVLPVAVMSDGRLLYSESAVAYTSRVSPEQKLAIQQGMDIWSDALGGGITYHEIPNTANDLKMAAGHRFLGTCSRVILYDIVKADDQRIVDEDKEKENEHKQTIGLTYERPCGITLVLLVPERLKSHQDVVETAAHEFGHALGLDHVDSEGAIMHKTHSEKTKGCLLPDDAEELCDNLHCLVDDVKLCPG